MLISSCTRQTRPQGRVFALSTGQAGYTLVELVVVMLLIGILAATAMPKFFGASRFEEMGFADASAAAARFAQKLAVSSGCDTRFTVDASGYALHQRQTSCAAGPLNRTVNRPGGQAWAEAVPGGVAVGSLSVYFDGQGRPHDAGSGSLLGTAVSCMVGSRSITIQPQTGFVQVL